MCVVVIHYRERKLLSDIDTLEMAGKASKTTDALDARSLPAPSKTSKTFLPRKGTIKDPLSREEMHSKSVESSNVFCLEWCGS
ncbi:hypothetical protein TNCV_4288121 [Trichonephila clavipes]|uniref:Uncharacterized protein n=1 Tax=Trichonephila clavipes TaxID=2585209 RepID=A0A8X6S8Z0_TRICX|nr:hypothetical protein TNCV_4288121 [Trichonephila clavipes]